VSPVGAVSGANPAEAGIPVWPVNAPRARPLARCIGGSG